VSTTDAPPFHPAHDEPPDDWTPTPATAPAPPKTNGKVERFNRTMKDEWLYIRAYASEEDRRAALVPFLNTYNYDRPHTSIGNKPPMSRAPSPGPRLTAEPIVVPTADRHGQLALDLLGDNNLPRDPDNNLT